MIRPRSVMLIAVLLVAGCGGGQKRDAGDSPRVASSGPSATAPAPEPAAAWPSPKPYEPDPAEGYPNGKRLASRIALRAVTYPRGASARRVAARLGRSALSTRTLAAVIDPVVDPRMASSAEVVYPQLSGVTETSLGAMVVVRQRLEDPDGRTRTVARVLDVRLRRSGGPWRLERIASVGGRETPRPKDLSGPAREVVDNPRITLSDSARWDIYRGEVDDGLLAALDRLARRHRVSVSVLRSGHPREVWGTRRASAHSRGYAADVYKIDGRLVIRQREPGSRAAAAARSLVEGGAAQLGSPWVLGPGGPRSFTDAVHQDHIHLQWSPLP